MSKERDKLIKLAREKPLGDLAYQVLRGSYLAGVDDTVLIKRCEKISKSSTRGMNDG